MITTWSDSRDQLFDGSSGDKAIEDSTCGTKRAILIWIRALYKALGTTKNHLCVHKTYGSRLGKPIMMDGHELA